MAAVVTSSSFATSNGVFRTSQSQLATSSFSYSDSALTQLPTVNLNFEDLQHRMATFTAKFDAFIEQGRKRVLEERNVFRARLGEMGEEQRSTKTQISTLHSSLATQSQIVAREDSEKSDMHAQISRLESHHSTQMATRDRLKTSISQIHRHIDAKVQAQRDYGEKADAQSRLNGPELTFWETYLGCRIDGSGEDNKVKITYVFPATKAVKSGGGIGGEREAVFDLCIPQSHNGAYVVSYMKPKLDEVKVQRVLDKLNATKEISTLLKGMRGLFLDDMK